MTTAPTTHTGLRRFVDDFSSLTAPERVEWCDGSREEYERLCQLFVEQGTFDRLAESKRPDSFWARFDPRDVARVEARTSRLSQFWGRELLSSGSVGRVPLGTSSDLWTRAVLLDECFV